MTKSENMEYSLSDFNMKSIPFEKYEKDFTFIVNGKAYFTTRIIADLISPVIRNLHFTDESINEYSININSNTNQKEDYFTEFLHLSSFEKTYLDEARRKLYSAYFLAVGNIQECILLQPDYFETLNSNNVVDRLLFIESQLSIESDTIHIKERLLKFIASHFDEINKDEMKKIKYGTLDEIMKSDNLKITNEDSLLKFILELYSIDQTASFLFGNVIFVNVTSECLSSFIETFSIDDLNTCIWSSLCDRFFDAKKKAETRYGKCQKETAQEEAKCVEIEYEKGKEFEGIMKYLSKKTGGNIHDNGTIEITTNSIDGDNSSLHPKCLVEQGNNNEYYNKDEADTFVCFDFKSRPIQLSSYSVQTCGDSQNGYHMRNWIVEASENGNDWTVIDRHSNDQTLNSSLVTANFQISNKNSGFYRYIRLHQTGYSWRKYPNSNHYNIDLRFIEFFGKLQEPKDK